MCVSVCVCVCSLCVWFSVCVCVCVYVCVCMYVCVCFLWLQDLLRSSALTREMHRVVEFNVAQVIDFELRQAHTTL